ncbi:uncharacterized protein YpmB [Scopulibacillus daqui]|uniref:Uncharacterized protein YpmB n=1 Tax=Scopulibacillus daqui TaxID=1469162 RepID=A0ABS2Q1F3_9BACL|nr:hypothetical protein [Scopulibacillus daqui]MBM7645352.1 uncharacterized protein YpmB [Scopulibacillus daqui]
MKKMRKQLLLVVSVCLMLTLVLVGCNTANKQNNKDNAPTKQTAKDQNGKTVDLRKYSKADDKNKKNADFNITGKYIKDDSKEVELNINGDDVHVKKAADFKKNLKGFKGNLKDKKVDVEVTHDKQQAKSLEPTPMTLADKNGIYERKNDGSYSVIGKLLTSDKTHISVQVPSGKKTYTKTSDFKQDTNGHKVNLTDKQVRLDIDKDGKVKELKYDWVDQE